MKPDLEVVHRAGSCLLAPGVKAPHTKSGGKKEGGEGQKKGRGGGEGGQGFISRVVEE